MTTVAIIEENSARRALLVDLVNSEAEYRCVCACSSSREALLEVPKHQPDVALMDVHLPDESGTACTAQLTGKMPWLQVIMVTVCKDAEMVFQSLRAGACGYILRSSRPGEIIQAIAEAKAGGAPMSREIARMVVRSFRASSTAPDPNPLTARETQILALLAKGLSNKEIAHRANISAGTVRIHLGNMFKKLHVRSRTEAAIKYSRKSQHGAVFPGVQVKFKARKPVK
jgi:DNA-binding NarL/FixJ family response regulator